MTEFTVHSTSHDDMTGPTIHAPEQVYLQVAEARAERWGYTKTLDRDQMAKLIRQQVEDVNLRADVDLVWHLALTLNGVVRDRQQHH